MSLPNISSCDSVNRTEAINLLLASVALEEIGLSNILNAEGEKLQHFLKSMPKDLYEYLKINDSVNQTLRTIIKSQIMLQLKLEDIVLLDKKSVWHQSDSESTSSDC
ncbi:MAG: hypothetical protein ACI35R_17950 [Bacillus sp. (in: firmicutes)]